MKAFANVNPRDLKQALAALGQAREAGRRAVPAGGGSDLLGLIKERLVDPDLVVHLGSIPGLDRVSREGGGLRVGGLITLETLAAHAEIRRRYEGLADAAVSVATPQIRNAGTLAGNICQRPWCWYLRNNFPCLKNGGTVCFSATGENQFHAIFGGGPSYIVHPSDTAPALVAFDATFRLASPRGERDVRAADFFTLPSANAAVENVLAPDELLVSVLLPAPRPGARSAYYKVMDREAWTHAVVSAAVVLDLDGDVCRSARIVLGGVAPIPWRLPKVEALLAGRRLTAELAGQAGEAAVEGARPLAKNGYKVPLTRSVVKRALLSLGS
jgi:xanthine dehydrogenase YagS FAD-binding subunit